MLLQQFLAVSNVALVFLTAVLASAVAYGLWPSLFACLVSVLAYNFFFLPPLYTFTIADPENVVALFFFAVVAVIASNLTARVRAQALTARVSAPRPQKTSISSAASSRASVTLDDLLWATAYQIASMLRSGSCCCCRKARARGARRLSAGRYAGRGGPRGGQMVLGEQRPAGRGADTLPGAKRLFLPMRTGRGAVGVVGLDSDRPVRC